MAGAEVSSVGGSRAAKRRAKKNKKQQQQSTQGGATKAQAVPVPVPQSPPEGDAGDKRRASASGGAADIRKKTKKAKASAGGASDAPPAAPPQRAPLPSDAAVMDVLRSFRSGDGPYADALSAGEAALARILGLPGDDASPFFTDTFERSHLLVQGGDGGGWRGRFGGFLSSDGLFEEVGRGDMLYGKDLNVTNTSKGVRKTYDAPPAGDGEPSVADPHDVRRRFSLGCSVRLLRPQSRSPPLSELLNLLESHLGCTAGCNAYLTPVGNQGFAAHYDDVDVFILQLEGAKRWECWEAPSPEEILARTSSSDFSRAEVEKMGDPMLDAVLRPGDALYLPRGTVHRAVTSGSPGDDASLHLTISAMQGWSWADLVEQVMPAALEAASGGKGLALRKGLPRGFLDYMGTMHGVAEGGDPLASVGGKKEDVDRGVGDEEGDAEAESDAIMAELQNSFKKKAKEMILRVCKEAVAMIDDGCDQMAIRFMSERQPSTLAPHEAAGTLANDDEAADAPPPNLRITLNSHVRLARTGTARIVVQDGMAVLYHCAANTVACGEGDLEPLEFEVDDAPALEQIVTTVAPDWISVQDLIHGEEADKVGVARALYDEGIVAVRRGL